MTSDSSFNIGNPAGTIDGLDLADMSDSDFANYLAGVNKTNSREAQLNPSIATNSTINSSTGALGSLTDQAQQLAQYNLGLNEQQETFDSGLRNTEANADTGRQEQLNTQQDTWQSQLNQDTQNAQTGRLQMQLSDQDAEQQAGFNQQNSMTDNAVRLASRQLGS